MRLVRFELGGRTGYGVHRGDRIHPLSWDPYGDLSRDHPPVEAGEAVLLSPVVPTKIVAVGLNYRDHAEELGMEVPPEPVMFLKPPTAVVGSGSPVVYPRGVGRLDYEAELAVVVGSEGKSIPPGKASDHVLGYTCSLDMTARDLQEKDGQWTRAKSFDSFCPLGPWVETELDPSDLEIELKVNGERRQRSRTSMMAFGVESLVAFVSSVMTIRPGDVILTGTPAGVGEVAEGDRLEVRIEGIGTLESLVTGPLEGPGAG